MHRVLVVDDRADIRFSLAMLLEDNEFAVIQADNPAAAQEAIKANAISLILLDMNFSLDTTSGGEGLGFLKWLQDSEHTIPTIAMTAWSNIELVINAMKLGANDFIGKPWKNKHLLHAIEQQLELSQLQHQNARLKQRLSQRHGQPHGQYEWRSGCMLQLLSDVEAIANTGVSVLLRGDNGSGKSELARSVHRLSGRKDSDLIEVNMGAISDALFESEMFGHKKGAFTDAKNNRIGRFELAENGTLFLDEIANIPMSQQAKMLRVLESGEYEVLGSSKTQRADFRLISATNADIDRLIKEELFREDLYFRLNTIEFTVPPLAARRDDVIPLAEHFIALYSHKYQRDNKPLSDNARQTLLDYHWPGNIRELSHLVERSILLSNGQVITTNDLHLSDKTEPHTSDMPLMTLEAAEIQLINRALAQTQNNVPKAAALLGLSKASMYRRLEKYGLATI